MHDSIPFLHPFDSRGERALLRQSRAALANTARLLLLAGIACSSLVAQELLAVTPGGFAAAMTQDGSQRRIVGATGLPNFEAMAELGGVFYAAGGIGGPNWLARIDPITGDATVLTQTLPHTVRGLSHRPGHNELYAVVAPTLQPMRLVRILLPSLAVVDVGSTGRFGLTALHHDGSALFTWDTTSGLMRLDETFGLATDVNPVIGTQGRDVEFLTRSDSGKLLGGNTQLFEIFETVGIATQLGPNGTTEMHGAEPRDGLAQPFGTGCPTPQVPFATMQVTGPLVIASSMQWSSTRHGQNAIGALIVGLSTTSTNGLPLPLDLDPLLGTSGCDLLVSTELLRPAVADQFGAFIDAMPLPPVFGGVLHFQVVALDQVPGGFSLSNAVTVRIPF